MKIGFMTNLDLNLYQFRFPIMDTLVKKGHEVYAICPEGDYSHKFKDDGIIHVSYTLDRGSLNPFKEKFFIDNIYNSIKDIKLDMLNTFNLKPNIYGTIAAKNANIPIVINLVEGLGSFYVENKLKNIIVRKMLERLYKKTFSISDKTIFVNHDDPKYMMDNNIIQKEKVQVIRSVGVNTELFSPKYKVQKEKLKEKLGIKKNKVIVLMVARAIWHKGVKEYYEAASKFHGDNVVFIFAGGTDKGNPSCADESFLNSGNVQWLGHRDDITDLTALADICVLPSYREGIPKTLLEAASMGKPIVTTDSVGCREVVEDGHNGFLVPIKDTILLYEKIKLLSDDPKLRETMGNNGREKTIKEFDVKNVITQYMSLYSEYIDI